MISKLPKMDEERITKHFAIFPVQCINVDGEFVRVYLGNYWIREVATYRDKRWCGWNKNRYWPYSYHPVL